jgi:ATPase subunit of ABC transporter with duplicated ATPase domains
LAIASVAQELPHSRRAVVEHVIDGDEALRALEARLAVAEQAGDGLRQATLLAEVETSGGYTARSRAASLLDGLGFDAGDIDRPLDEFSGGLRMRANLARALMCRSDVLLLDEPTNHLDLDAVLWLEDWLCAYSGTLLLVSHDRDFSMRWRPASSIYPIGESRLTPVISRTSKHSAPQVPRSDARRTSAYVAKSPTCAASSIAFPCESQ